MHTTSHAQSSLFALLYLTCAVELEAREEEDVGRPFVDVYAKNPEALARRGRGQGRRRRRRRPYGVVVIL